MRNTLRSPLHCLDFFMIKKKKEIMHGSISYPGHIRGRTMKMFVTSLELDGIQFIKKVYFFIISGKETLKRCFKIDIKIQKKF